MQGPSFVNQDIGLKERLIRVFYEPHTSFAAVYQRETPHDWFIPVLLATLVGLASHYMTLDIAMDLDAPAVQQHLEGLSEEERKEAIDNREKIRAHSWMMVPVGVFASLVLIGGILLLLARSLFKSEVTYQQMLIVKGYASLVLIPEWIVRTFLTLVKGSPAVHTGLGMFVPEEMVNTFAGKVLIQIDFFDCWQAWVIGIGLAVMANVPAKRALAAIFVLWGLWIVGGAAIEPSAQAPGFVPPGE